MTPACGGARDLRRGARDRRRHGGARPTRCRSSPSPRATRENVLEWVYPAAGDNDPHPLHDRLALRLPHQRRPTGRLLLRHLRRRPPARATASRTTPLANGDHLLLHGVRGHAAAASGRPGKTNSGKPFPTAGPVEVGVPFRVFSTTAPTVGGAGVIATNNDNAVHAMTAGPAAASGRRAGGRCCWAARCRAARRSCRSPSAARTPWCSWARRTATSTRSTPRSARAAPAPWAAPAPSASIVQAAPAGLFTAFGGRLDYLLVGTRDAGADNVLMALDPAYGSRDRDLRQRRRRPTGIGIISGMAAVDYATSRVYFTSDARREAARTRSGACSSATSWRTASSALVWARALGGIESSAGAPRRPCLRRQHRRWRHALLDRRGGRRLDRTIAPIVTATGRQGLRLPRPQLAHRRPLLRAANRGLGRDRDPHRARQQVRVRHACRAAPCPSLLRGPPRSHYVYVGGNDGRAPADRPLTGVVRHVDRPRGEPPRRSGPRRSTSCNGLVHVGTAAGVFFAIEVPLP